MKEQPDVRIFGINHTDDRIHEPIDHAAEHANSPDMVFHEWPQSNEKTRTQVFWLLFKNPFNLLLGGLKLLEYRLKMGRGFTTEPGEGTMVKSECRIATERLDEEYDAARVPIGTGRVKRLKQMSYMSSFLSWSAIAVLLLFLALGITRGPGYLLFISVAVLIGISNQMWVQNRIRPLRDKNMADQIIDGIRSKEPESVFIVVGENHVEGIAKNLGACDIYPECRWVVSELEAAE